MSERKLAWAVEGWEDCLCWQSEDRKTLKRIDTLIADCLRDDPFVGIGNPNPSSTPSPEVWSRRIDEANRLVYIADEHYVTVLQARYHY